MNKHYCVDITMASRMASLSNETPVLIPWEYIKPIPKEPREYYLVMNGDYGRVCKNAKSIVATSTQEIIHVREVIKELE